MINTNIVQPSYVLNSCEDADFQMEQNSQHFVSIYNDTDEKIKVDFSFSYMDEYYRIAANIGKQGQITKANSGIEIASKKWQKLTISNYNEFHRSKSVEIKALFQLTVNGQLIYDAYKYQGKGSNQRIQSYEFDYSKERFDLPCFLKISKT
ncbi:MAG: hypothetical protein H0V82_11230 [Candidatus Protochlamydia sp.]|nr:hypothetical protein [Candidatus Protochlamydia sp.]